jgi:RNA polymerase primary sigma factor
MNNILKELPPVLSRDEEKKLGKKLKSKNKKTVEEAGLKLVEHNIRLVIKIANDYSHYSGTLDTDDLITEGSLGLMDAVKKFDIDKGVKFSTYSAYWIKQRIRRAIGNQSRTVRVPVHLLDKHRKIKSYIDDFSFKFNCLPSIEAIQKEFDVSKAVALHTLNYKGTTTSLQMSVGDGKHNDTGGHSELEAIFIDENQVSPSETTELSDGFLNLFSHMKKVLNKREREIIKTRYGIKTGEQVTLEETGELFGLTRERIRQICNSSLLKLKKSYARKSC